MRKIFERCIFLGLLITIVTGCATVTRGTTEVLVIETIPAGATARLSSGKICITPCSLTLSRKESFSISFEKNGYYPASTHVSSGISTAGGVGMAGNVLVGGLIGIGVDSYSGANKSLLPNPVRVTLEKIDD